MSIGERLNDAIGSALEESERIERKEAPRRERLAKLRKETPRVIFRDPGTGYYGSGRAAYSTLRLADVRYEPARTETSYELGSSKPHKRHRSATVYVQRGGGGYGVAPARLGEFVRRPTTKALRRLEEAEEALRAAHVAVRDAERAAFTYGKPVTLAAVQDVTRRHKAAWDEGAP